jgi:crotonobetainyl-CoA:carnitine CoA-transferase CaiB-like acyl-CoA transferase
MASSSLVTSIGAACFGVVTGYITYRTLARTTTPHIAAVVAAVGGGAVTAIFPAKESDAFGWYSIGLVAGMALYLALFFALRGRSQTGGILTQEDDPGPG